MGTRVLQMVSSMVTICLDSFTDGLMDPKCLTHLASQGMVHGPISY